MLSNVLDGAILQNNRYIRSTRSDAKAESSLFPGNEKEQFITVALDFVEQQTVKLFLNQVNTPYIAVKVKNHTETMP